MSAEIDPQLPYIQVHRGVGPKAAQLATALDVTYQHARGSLDVFWESVADRRLLVEDGKARTELVLPAKDLETRLKLAFGKPVDLTLMEALGFLQPREGGTYRIRGASRMLNVEAGRLKKKSGTTYVPSETNPGVVLVPPESDPESNPGPTPVRPRVGPESEPTEVRGERRELRGEREETKGNSSGSWRRPHPLEKPAGRLKPPDIPPEKWGPLHFWQWAQAKREGAGFIRELAPHPDKLKAWWSEVLGAECAIERLKLAWYAYGGDAHWAPQGCPFGAFMSQWPKWVPREEAKHVRP